MHILFICTGNTCRSPMAEGILRHLQTANEDWQVLSAGLYPAPGAPANELAQRVAQEHGLDLSAHRSRRLAMPYLEAADYIVTMTEDMAEQIRNGAPEFAEKVQSLGTWSGLGGDVGDPFGGDIEMYRRCYEEIEKKITAALQRLENFSK